jgi:hypothetical protein
MSETSGLIPRSDQTLKFLLSDGSSQPQEMLYEPCRMASYPLQIEFGDGVHVSPRSIQSSCVL